MIEAENLVFDYPNLRALRGVSFSVAAGSITALVGPNGAGKTTLLRCLAGLETPVLGRVVVDGLDVHEHPRDCHRRMGYLSDFFGLYDALTVEQCLRYRAGAQGLPPARHAALIEKAAVRTGLSDRLGQKAGELSRGLRQRLAIAQAILHEPAIVLLDEPASGLDPDARLQLSDLLRALRGEGMTLVVSSHILAELEDYSTHMLLLRDGLLVEHHAVGEEGDAAQAVLLEIVLAVPNPALSAFLEAAPDCSLVSADEAAAKVNFSGDAAGRADLLKQLIQAGLAVSSFSVRKMDLQDVYLARSREAAGRGPKA